ncbi:hypothetical protein ACMFMG_011421 [Clarireedia jacksonii]
MPNEIRDIRTVDITSYSYIFEQNVSVPLKSADGVIRVNIYRPKSEGQQDVKSPVIVTYGPYGKDIPYEIFHPKSFAEVNPEHRGPHSAWETPDPGYWTRNGYAVVRADERGSGQSPGVLDTMSCGTSEAFFDVIEWAAEQSWSTGKVGLLGISYYGGSQWRVAARQPKGLAAIIPWEGMSDYYRDRCRQGGPVAQRCKLGGGICLHLRGNVQGWTWAGSELKYLRFITGRHDLPFYYKQEAEIQRSFLDAFLKNKDREGWSIKGKLPPVDLVLRKGDIGFNNAQAEQTYQRRYENEWPIARTQYTNFYLTPEGGLAREVSIKKQSRVSYKALGTLENPELVRFETALFEAETEITGHVVARLNVSVSPYPDTETTPSDIDLFLTLRHISPAGTEVHYTGTAGDPVPLTKGWLRASLRKTDHEHRRHRTYLPYRNYTSSDIQPVIVGEVYTVDVEIWPTNVVVEAGGKIIFEVASGDTQGADRFVHNDAVDRSREKFEGLNHIHFDPSFENYVTLPIIPPK